MTKYQISQEVAMKSGLTISQVSEVFDGIMECIQDAVSIGRTVNLRGFGAFEPRFQKEKIGRNVKKGIPVIIPEKMVVKFKAANHFKARVANKEIGF